MIKILHISDIHFGAKLGNFSQNEEIKQALDFILAQIQLQNIDILVIAGDIFDKSNPSAEAENSYYEFISKIYKLNITTVIISGNHDNDIRLNAPQKILNQNNIYIFSSLNTEVLKLKINNQDINFLPISYFSEEKLQEKLTELNIKIDTDKKNNIDYLYLKLLEHLYKNSNSDAIKIALGHLYIQNSEPVGNELPIQRGNLDQINFQLFNNLDINYFAFGHIHKFQKVSDNAFYSGSIIPISIDESQNKKFMVMISFNENSKQPEIETIEIPKFTNYYKFSGSFDEILQGINIAKSKNEIRNSFVSFEFLEQLTFEENHAVNNLIKELNLKVVSKSMTSQDHKSKDFNLLRQEVKNLSVDKLFNKFLDSNKSLNKDLKINLINKFNKIYEDNI